MYYRIYLKVNPLKNICINKKVQGSHGTWKKGNFLIKSGGKVEKVREKSGKVFVLFVCLVCIKL